MKVVAAIGLGAVMLVMASSATTVVATRLITGDDVADRSLTGADIQRGSVKGNRLKPGTVALRHLDRDSVRAGHVHTDKEPLVIGESTGVSGATPPSGRDSESYVTLVNGVTTTVATVSGLAAGKYVVSATGGMYLQAVIINNGAYGTSGSCSIESASTTVTTQSYQNPYPWEGDFFATVAMSRVVTLTSPGSFTVTCELATAQGFAVGESIGQANIDLLAMPVTSYTAG